MISYITSRKKTIVPSQSLDSAQQQHACKDVYKFFILPKKNRYINHKIITIIHKNQIIRNKMTQKNILLRVYCVYYFGHCVRHSHPSASTSSAPNNSTKPNSTHQLLIFLAR